MLSEMTPQQMNEIAAYDRISPIGIEKVCRTIARGFATLFNMFAKEGAEPFDPAQLMPWVERSQQRKPGSARVPKRDDEANPGATRRPTGTAAAFFMAAASAGEFGNLANFDVAEE
jgi:hypothetical protein